MKKSLQEIINSMRDQARDKAVLANGDEYSIFAQDAKALCKAIDLLEKLIAERDEYKRRSEAAEADILEMLIEEGGNLDLCHWCAGNCPDNDYSQCEQKIRWRGPCTENGHRRGRGQRAGGDGAARVRKMEEVMVKNIVRKIVRKFRRANEWLQTALCWCLEMMRSDLERIERERNQGCEYCQPDDCCSPLSWKYGLDHIFPDYRFCPMCGRKIGGAQWL